MNPGTKPLLVVDDEYSNRDLLARRLRRAGYLVETAEDASHALEIIHSREVELVLLDTMMPGMTGVDLLKLLRATHTPMELPIIMVTALSDSQRVVEALSNGANDYVTKPVDFPVTLARIQAQLTHKCAAERLRQSEERYSLAARANSEGLWDWNLDTGNLYLSPQWKNMLGYGLDELEDKLEEWLGRVHPEDRPRLEPELQLHSQADQPCEWSCEYRILHQDGCYRWMAARAAVVCGSGGKARRITGSQTDITKTKASDPLTGLANRCGLFERVTSALARTQVDRQYRFALLFVDLDRFKLINDRVGQSVGARLLVGVARRLEQAVRTGCARLGGEGLASRLDRDEFVVFMENVRAKEIAFDLAMDLLHAIGEPQEFEGREVTITASIGVALGDATCASASALLRDADMAKCRAKSAGRARCQVFDVEMRDAAKLRQDIELDLQRAVDHNEFVVYYQPKVRLKTGELLGFEALVRWNHPTRGLISPAEFIPVSEQTGHIQQIGLWVLREACTATERWRRDLGLPLTIAVNVSAKQLHRDDFAGKVKAVLEATELDAAALKLEVTESILIDRLDDALKTIAKLHDLGVGLEIDDFGTGYSSFGSLNALPFDALKIDKSFVDGIAGSANHVEIVQAMLSVASSLGLGITAEGVETTGQMDWLRSAGCEIGQGYLFAKPMPSEAVPNYIRTYDLAEPS